MQRYNCTLSQWWSRRVKAFSNQDSNLQVPITLTENHGISARNFASFPINRQAMNGLAAAEIHFADRKQKVEFQPALRLARSKTNHLFIN
jgi:hypothetical protein